MALSNDPKSALCRKIDASLGRIPVDSLLKGAQILDIFHLRWAAMDLAIFDGSIVAMGPSLSLKAEREMNLSGKWVVPGFIDAHVHLESSLMVPSSFEKLVLKCGTTTAICDPHELANVWGGSGIKYFLDAAQSSALDLRVMLSSCVPATHMETNGGGTLSARDLSPMMAHPHALGLAEMMNVPGVLNKDAEILEKLALFGFGSKPIDGHSPLLRGRDLDAYLVSGISSCHESTELAEAHEKVSKGMSVWIREGSVAKDLSALYPLINQPTLNHVGFCTDDRNPLDILDEGHIDHLVRKSISLGVDPKLAYRMASYSVAQHYGLHRGPNRMGAIAPGFRADLIILDDPKSCAISQTLLGGIPYDEISFQKPTKSGNTGPLKAHPPEPKELEGPKGQVHVIEVLEGKIITGRSVSKNDQEGVSRLTVLERHGHYRKPANGYVRGFGKLEGAIASSVGHDSHNLIVVGNTTESMALALKALIEAGGGFCVVNNAKVAEILPLPIGGLMTDQDPLEISQKLKSLKQAAREIGCALHEPFLQLAFLSLPVIPSLKLTDLGLVDVEKFSIIPVGV